MCWFTLTLFTKVVIPAAWTFTCSPHDVERAASSRKATLHPSVLRVKGSSVDSGDGQISDVTISEEMLVRTVPSECDDVIRRAHVSRSRGLPHREVTDGLRRPF